MKTAIKHLKKSGGKKWGNIEQVASFLYEYQEQLDANQVSEFLASKSSSVYTKEEHCELRELWGKHIDFTGFDFEKAWRHFLMDCGVLIAGLEGQAVERMMELFAVMFCRDNSGIFKSTGKIIFFLDFWSKRFVCATFFAFTVHLTSDAFEFDITFWFVYY